VAHTREDFIETVWLRLLAGSSPLFWNAMPARRPGVFRPLLGVARSELTSWSEGAYEDPMNRDQAVDRVWLRQSGLLAALDPSGAVADAAARCGQRLAALGLDAPGVALDRLPAALRYEVVRARLRRLLPAVRPRRRFVAEIAAAAARPNEKSRKFSTSGAVVTLRQGELVLTS
jgi:tRNA(Ile)-lysidine synthase TilS/MesJ